MDWVRKRYADFGPTLACEKLTEVHGYRLSVETLRRWMMAEGLWTVKSRRRARIHQRRPRRACLGELVQLDGSPHAWFEDRGERCTLIVFIDDATSRLLYLRFVPAETTQAYMEALGVYLSAYGRPVALYSDRHSIFRVNHGRQEGKGYRLRGASVVVCDAFGAGVKVLHKGRPLTFRVLAEGEAPVALDDEKSVQRTVDEAKARQRAQPGYKPPLDHPWNRMIRLDVAEANQRRAAR